MNHCIQLFLAGFIGELISRNSSIRNNYFDWKRNLISLKIPAKKRSSFLVLANAFRGGLASYNERLACKFQLEEHDVEIFTSLRSIPNFLFPGKSQFSEEPAPKNIKITRKVSFHKSIQLAKNWQRNQTTKTLIYLFSNTGFPFMGPCFGTICASCQKK